MKIINQEIKETKVSELKVHPDNPRQGNVSDIARSIEINGFYGAIVAQKSTGFVLAGNHRLMAAKETGAKTIPVAWVDCDDEEARRILLADNRLSDLATYDESILATLLEELAQTEIGLDGTGYDSDFLDELARSNLENEEGLTDPDEVPDIPNEPVTKPGDLWLLGDHRLLCGDSTSIEDLERLVGDEKVSLWITDPPYNVDYVGKSKAALKIENDKMADEEFRSFLREAYFAADTVMRPGAVFYIWHADSEGYNFRGAAKDIGWKVRQCLIWLKNTMVMGRQDYHWKHEPCLYGWKPGAAHYWGTDRKQTTILEFDRPSRSNDHPTMKPVELFQYQVENSSKPLEVVLDSFGGSGTTLIVCQQTNRKARIMELDPKYCDVIVSRWENFTGRKAVLEAKPNELELLDF